VFDALILIMLAAAFAGALGYVRACANLVRANGTTKDKAP
jgi:hypothetical protein